MTNNQPTETPKDPQGSQTNPVPGAEEVKAKAEQLNTDAKAQASGVKSHTAKLNEYIERAGKVAREAAVVAKDLQTKVAPHVAKMGSFLKDKLAEAKNAVEELRRKQAAKKEAQPSAPPKSETPASKTTDPSDHNRP